MLFATLVVHLPTYKLFQGEFFSSGGCNELLSFFILILLVFMFRQKEIDEKQIKALIKKFIEQKFKNTLQAAQLRRQSKSDSNPANVLDINSKSSEDFNAFRAKRNGN